MAEPKPDGIVKAWKAMDDATDAIAEAAKKCVAAAKAIGATTSSAKGKLARLYMKRAVTLSEIVAESRGK